MLLRYVFAKMMISFRNFPTFSLVTWEQTKNVERCVVWLTVNLYLTGTLEKTLLLTSTQCNVCVCVAIS